MHPPGSPIPEGCGGSLVQEQHVEGRHRLQVLQTPKRRRVFQPSSVDDADGTLFASFNEGIKKAEDFSELSTCIDCCSAQVSPNSRGRSCVIPPGSGGGEFSPLPFPSPWSLLDYWLGFVGRAAQRTTPKERMRK